MKTTDTVLNTINKYNMTADSKNVVVGLSGGADSVCLLHILFSLKAVLKVNLYACHLNHMLRGDEADRDEEFSEKLCEKLGISFEVKRLNISEIAKNEKKSFELCAREKRYEFFNECAKKYNAVVATAHTKSDSMETVIFNMMRGTSLKGLCGIPPKRNNVIRPLIEITREKVEEYCKENNLEFVSDSTNFDDNYKRNFIRHNVIPLLKEGSGNFSTVFSNMTTSLSNDEEYLDLQADKLLKGAKKENGRYDVCILLSNHKSLVFRVIAKILKENKISVDFEKVVLLYEMFSQKETKVRLSKNIYSIVKNGEFYFQSPLELQPYFEVELEINGENTIFDNKKVLLCEENKENLLTFLKLPKKDLKNLIDCGKISGVLVARQRREKDEVELLGRNCNKSLKKLFNESKTDIQKRSQTVVITDNNGIVWVEGFGVAQRCCVDETTKSVYKIQTIL